MDLMKIMWIACGCIWAVVIIGFIATVAVNRIRNRQRKDD